MSTIVDFRSAMSAILESGMILTQQQVTAIRDMVALTAQVKETSIVSELKLSVSGRKTLPPKDRLTAVNNHLAALRSAAMDRTAFEKALTDLLADKLVRTPEFVVIAAAYSGRKLKSKATRSDAEKLIRQAFSRESWQQEAYRRIEKLTAAE